MEEQYQGGVNGAEATHNESQKGKQSKLNFFATWILLGLIFALPIFALPFGVFALDFSKAVIFYTGVLVTFLLFVLALLKNGSVTVPRSLLLASMFAVAGAWLLSALFSPNKALSFIGAGYETGTFVFFLFLAIITLLVSTLFRSEKHILLSYALLLVSAMVLFVAQFLHSGFGVAVPPFQMFNDRLANLFGSWSDIGIFFGLAMILTIILLEVTNVAHIAKRVRIFLWVILTASFIVVFFVNFYTLWNVLGLVTLILGVYGFVTLPKVDEHAKFAWQKFMRPSIIAFLLILFFGLAQVPTTKVITLAGLQYTQVSPSWGTTLDIVGGSLSVNPMVGSGPNTFAYDWLVLKPIEIANTIYWDMRFTSGVSRALSMVAEVGLLGGVALTFLFIILLSSIRSVLSYKERDIKKVLLVTSLAGSIYLWTFVIVASPGFVIFTLAGIFTGLFVASLVLAEKIGTVAVTIPTNGTRNGVIARSVMFLVTLVSLYSVYVVTMKYMAGYFYTSALNKVSIHNDIDRADTLLKRVVRLDPQDVYYRSTAELGLLRLKQIVAQTSEAETVSDADKALFQSVLGETVQSAKNAVSVNPLDPFNWVELGRVYEAILPFDTAGLKESAITSYKEAILRSPYDPSLFVALARIELQLKNPDEALKYLQESIKIKSNFTTSHLMIAQVDAEAGRLKDAISELESTVIADPNNPDNPYLILQIGILYYQDSDYEKAQSIFERLVEVNPNHADARYALGLLYDKKGMHTRAKAQFEELNKLIPGNEEIQKILNNLRVGYGALGNDLTPTAPPVEPENAPLKTGTKKK